MKLINVKYVVGLIRKDAMKSFSERVFTFSLALPIEKFVTFYFVRL